MSFGPRTDLALVLLTSRARIYGGQHRQNYKPHASELLPSDDSMKSPSPSILIAAAAVSWIALVTYGSLVPLNYEPMPWHETLELARSIPWLSIDIGGRADLVANGALFFPCGLLLTAALSRAGGPLGRGLSAVIAATLLMMWACGIEVVQIWFPGRTVSMNDIFSEAIGSWVGALTWACFGPDIHGRTTALVQSKGRALQIALLEAYIVGLLIYALVPFDLILSLSELRDKISLNRIGWGWTDTKAVLLSIALFVPVGVYAFLRESRRYNALKCAASIAITYELLQFPVYSRTVALSHAIAAATGAVIGIVLAQKRRYWDLIKERRVPVVTTVIYMIGVTATFWYPFVISPADLWASRLSSAWRAPFSTHYYGSEFQTLSNVALRAVLFGTGGGLIYLSGRIQLIAAVGIVITWPAVTEMAQIFFAEKLADLTDAGIGVFSAFSGIWVAKLTLSRMRTC